MIYGLQLPSHHQNQCWLTISEVQRQSPGISISQDEPQYKINEKIACLNFILKSPRGQWVEGLYKRIHLIRYHMKPDNKA